MMVHQVRCATLNQVQFGVFTSANSNNDEPYAALVGYSVPVIEYIMKAAGIWVIAFIVAGLVAVIVGFSEVWENSIAFCAATVAAVRYYRSNTQRSQ